MAEINRSEVIQGIQDKLDLQFATDIPKEIKGNIVPVFNVNETGIIRTIAAATTSNTYTLTVPTGKKYEIISAYFVYVPSATVGNRNPTLTIFYPTSSTLFWNLPNANVAASTTTRYLCQLGAGNISNPASGYYINPIPLRTILPEGFSLRFYDSASIDTADTIQYRIIFREMSMSG